MTYRNTNTFEKLTVARLMASSYSQGIETAMGDVEVEEVLRYIKKELLWCFKLDINDAKLIFEDLFAGYKKYNIETDTIEDDTE